MTPQGVYIPVAKSGEHALAGVGSDSHGALRLRLRLRLRVQRGLGAGTLLLSSLVSLLGSTSKTSEGDALCCGEGPGGGARTGVFEESGPPLLLEGSGSRLSDPARTHMLRRRRGHDALAGLDVTARRGAREATAAV